MFMYLFSLILVIENLPMEMRDRLTEMREMDLQVQSKLMKMFILPVKQFKYICLFIGLLFWVHF